MSGIEQFTLSAWSATVVLINLAVVLGTLCLVRATVGAFDVCNERAIRTTNAVQQAAVGYSLRLEAWNMQGRNPAEVPVNPLKGSLPVLSVFPTPADYVVALQYHMFEWIVLSLLAIAAMVVAVLAVRNRKARLSPSAARNLSMGIRSISWFSIGLCAWLVLDLVANVGRV